MKEKRRQRWTTSHIVMEKKESICSKKTVLCYNKAVHEDGQFVGIGGRVSGKTMIESEASLILFLFFGYGQRMYPPIGNEWRKSV